LVPGIGPVPAQKILQMRKSYGVFKCGRPDGHSRNRAEALGKNEDVSDGREAAIGECRATGKVFWMFDAKTARACEIGCEPEDSAYASGAGAARCRNRRTLA
jgi:hypothetical protein